MKKILIYLSIFFYCCTAYSQSQLDEFILSRMEQFNIPGLSACIVKKGRLAWAGNYGYADIQNKIPVTGNTIFMLASVSKTVTGTALMQVFQNGGFKLDDSINAYLPFSVVNPFFPNIPITFKMLMTHTSSIQDNWDAMPVVLGDHPMSLDEYMRNYFIPGGLYYESVLNFHYYEPGSQWNYSNVAVALCGYLVESITHTPFDKYCSDSIFNPLCMEKTSWFLKDLDTSSIARTYDLYDSVYIDNGLYGFPDYPDGQLRTTAISLAKFLKMNMEYGKFGDKRVLESNTIKLITTEQLPGQGLIWARASFQGKTLIAHTGGDKGVSTFAGFILEDTLGLVILTNMTGGLNDTILINSLIRLADTIPYLDAPILDCGYVSISEKLDKRNDINIFPNPAKDFIRVIIPDYIQHNTTVYIINSFGISVSSLYLIPDKSQTYDINISNLTPGVYFCRIKAGNHIETKQFMILR